MTQIMIMIQILLLKMTKFIIFFIFELDNDTARLFQV